MEYSSDLKKEYEGYMRVKQNIVEFKTAMNEMRDSMNERHRSMNDTLNHIYSLAEQCLKQEIEADKQDNQK
ncbi:hypothetical protein [Terribacillus sp. AE2B 122]|uniref:hypothetical protein n=1 Tax=Terribacillus sp. AE2B 122 TaxID=1331902 RepID=UPI0015821988|nr:hypothetical protein [Terribacillus sp. AE2B 122]